MTDEELAAVEQAAAENVGGPVPRATVLDLIARVRAAESACAGSEEHCDQIIEDRDRWKARAEKAEKALAEVRHEVRSFDATGCDGWHAESVVDTFRQIFERMPEPCEFCGDGPCPHGCGEEAA